MPPPDQLAKIAADLEASARRLKAKGDHEGAAAAFEAAADLREALRGLQGGASERIVRSMNVDTTRHTADVKRGATRARRKHPAQKRLYEQGMTIASLAKQLGETRARVSSWMADGDGLRPIPAGIAEKLRQQYGIPLSVWKRVSE